MSLHFAFLRGINVGGHRKVAMEDLRKLLVDLGFSGARTVLQSGNLAFQAEGRTGAQLEKLLEEEAERRLGLRTDFIVRTAPEWAAIAADNPLAKEAERDPSHLLVMVLKDAPAPGCAAALDAAIRGGEVVRVRGKNASMYYPDGIGRSRLTGALIEKKLGTRGTARNWNTVLRLQNLAAGGESSD